MLMRMWRVWLSIMMLAAGGPVVTAFLPFPSCRANVDQCSSPSSRVVMEAAVQSTPRIMTAALPNRAATTTTTVLPAKPNRDYEYTTESSIPRYNDLAFGFVSLGGLAVTQNVDFVATFVAVSALVATWANTQSKPETDDDNDNKKNNRLLPAVSALGTAILFPLVMSIHLSVPWTSVVASARNEFLFCLASVLVAVVDQQVLANQKSS